MSGTDLLASHAVALAFSIIVLGEDYEDDGWVAIMVLHIWRALTVAGVGTAVFQACPLNAAPQQEFLLE